MRTSRNVFATLLCGLAIHGCGGADSASHCDADDLRGALEDASAGDTVRAGACEIEGAFVVRDGVTLAGEGEVSRLVAPTDAIALVLEAGGAETTVTGLTIVVPAGARGGVVARGDGSGAAAVRAVRIDAATGTALGVERVASFVAEGVTLVGPVTAETSADACFEDLCTPGEAGLPREERSCSTIEELRACTATHGMVLVDVQSATLTDVQASGFALFGALLLDSTTTWHGGGVSDNLTTGLMVHGGSATLDGLELAGTIAGLRLVPAYAGVFAGGADVTTTGLTVADNENFGLLQDQATARHLDLVATDNRLAALWVQSSSSFELRGAGTRLSGNTLAGRVALDASDVTVAGDGPDEQALAIESTAGFAWPYDDLSQPTVGDGIQLLRTTEGVHVENVRLDDNARVGVLVDVGGGSIDDVTLNEVVANGTAGQNGVIAQDDRGLIPPGEGWDDGVERLGATEANDLAAAAALDVLPSALPAAKIPTLGDAPSDGLRGIMGPFD